METNIPDLESKLSFMSLKAVTWPQMISNGHHPENSFETFTRAVISSGHLALERLVTDMKSDMKLSFEIISCYQEMLPVFSENTSEF